MKIEPVNPVASTTISAVAILPAVDPQIIPFHQTDLWLLYIAGGSGAIIFLGVINGLFGLYRNIRRR